MWTQGSVYERQPLIRASEARVFCARSHLRNVRKADLWKAYPISAQKTILCHKNLPHCQIKMAARTNFTGKYSLAFSEKTQRSFGNQLMTNCTLGKEC